jgi:hypothetical protein
MALRPRKVSPMGAFAVRHFETPSVATASVPSPPKPRTGDTACGAGSREANAPQRCRNSDALLAPESQSFLDNVIAGFKHS